VDLPRLLIVLGVVGAVAVLIALPDLLASERAGKISPIEPHRTYGREGRDG
jgi:hypothetical protein